MEIGGCDSDFCLHPKQTFSLLLILILFDKKSLTILHVVHLIGLTRVSNVRLNKVRKTLGSSA